MASIPFSVVFGFNERFYFRKYKIKGNTRAIWSTHYRTLFVEFRTKHIN